MFIAVQLSSLAFVSTTQQATRDNNNGPRI